MSRTHISGIFSVIIKVLVFQQTTFVTNQTICLHLGRIKFDLQFDVFRHCMQRSTKFAYQNTVGFLQVIYISMIAISLFSQHLNLLIFIITHAIPQYSKEYSTLAFFFNQLFQSFSGRNAHIKITIGTKYDTVIAVRDQILLGYFIR